MNTQTYAVTSTIRGQWRHAFRFVPPREKDFDVPRLFLSPWRRPYDSESFSKFFVREFFNAHGLLRRLLPSSADFLLRPNHVDEPPFEKRKHSPSAIRTAFLALRRALVRQRDVLPIRHCITEILEDGERWEAGHGQGFPADAVSEVESDESGVILNGWHYDSDHRDDLRIMEISGSFEDPDIQQVGWKKYAPRMEFGGETLEITKQYADEVFADEFDQILTLCQQALRRARPLYWFVAARYRKVEMIDGTMLDFPI